MTTGQKISLIIFPIIVFIFLIPLNYFLSFRLDDKDIKLKMFYNEIENSLNAVFIGPSTIKNGIIPNRIYEKSGITSYSYTLDRLPTCLIPYMIEEIQNSQNPELIVIDINCVVSTSQDFVRDRVQNYISNIKDGENKKKIQKNIIDKDKSDFENDIPFVVNHYNWVTLPTTLSNLNIYDKMKCDASYLKGYISKTTMTGDSIYKKAKSWTKEESPMSEIELQDLDALLDYCQNLETQILFVRMPRIDISASAQTETKQMNYIGKYIINKGFSYIDFGNYLYDSDGNINMNNDFGLNIANDYADEVHLNIFGATKFSDWIANFICENYDFHISNNEVINSHWNNLTEQTRQYYIDVAQITQNKNLQELGELYFYKNYIANQ